MNESTKSRIRSRVVKDDSLIASDFQSWPKVDQVPWLLPFAIIIFFFFQSYLIYWALLFLWVFKIITYSLIKREIFSAINLRNQEKKQAAAEALYISNKIADEQKARQEKIKMQILGYMDAAFDQAISEYNQQFNKTINFPSITWKPNYWILKECYQKSPHIEDFSSLKKNVFARGMSIDYSISHFNKYTEPSIKIPNIKKTIEPYYFSGDSEKRLTKSVKKHRSYRSRNSVFLEKFLAIMDKEGRNIEELTDHDWNNSIEAINAKLLDQESFYQKQYAEFSHKASQEIDIFNKINLENWTANNLKFITESEEPKNLFSEDVQFFCNRLFRHLLNLPAWIPNNISTFWEKESKILIIQAEMPELGGGVYKIRQLKSGGKVVSATKKEAETFRQNVLFYYPILLAYLVAKNNATEWVEFICVNGFVNFIDPATGNPATANILSMAVDPKDIAEIDIKNIEPTACFKRFKGLSASKVADLIPVEPIISFKKEESRFIYGKDVADSVSGTNLALMDWQDFEYLVRQIFEEEFQSAGAEVRVTQSSRDKGVDAIIFDPDPIRGGKIVVQAKRYSHTVDVSAVRDLYGTVLNEGANSGIIITTSNYGKDSHDFAKDKPLKLLNGSNLLHLLEKHGHKAYIDLDEAKKKLAADRRTSIE